MGYVKNGAEFGDGDGGVTDRLDHADSLVAQRRLELRLTRRHDAYASARPATPTMRRILWMKLSISLVSQERQMPKEA